VDNPAWPTPEELRRSRQHLDVESGAGGEDAGAAATSLAQEEERTGALRVAEGPHDAASLAAPGGRRNGGGGVNAAFIAYPDTLVWTHGDGSSPAPVAALVVTPSA